MAQVAAAGIGYLASRSSSRRAASAANAQTAVAMRAQDLSEEQWDYYKENYQPLELELIASARDGVEPDYDAVVGRATADVAQGFDQAAAVRNRQLTRYGIDPTQFAESQNAMAIERAKALAFTTNNARRVEKQRAEDLTFARRLDVAGLGRGTAGRATALLNAASGQLGSAARSQMGIALATARGGGQIGEALGNYFNSNPALQGLETTSGTSGVSDYADSQV